MNELTTQSYNLNNNDRTLETNSYTYTNTYIPLTTNNYRGV